MKTRVFATLTALTLAGYAATAAHAEESAATLAWQESGYIMDVIVVTTPRSEVAAASLAWQEPDYVTEVVVTKASRSEVLAEAWAAARDAALVRQAAFVRGRTQHSLGMPTR
jgi:hypothetical protein